MLKMQDKYKNILIVVLFLLFICSLIAIFYLINSKKDILKEITGKVIVSDSSYVIVETEDDDYLVSNIKGEYKIGDEVKFSYLQSSLTNQDTLKSVKATDEDLVAAFQEEHEEVTKDTSAETEVIQKETTNTNTSSTSSSVNDSNGNYTPANSSSNETSINSTTNYTNTNASNSDTNQTIIHSSATNIENDTKKDADTEVLNYFSNLKSDFDASSIKDSVKSGFISVMDFLFYNGTIKGYTFKDLSNSAKLKVLSMALYFDNKIDTYFPGYKDSISNTANKTYNTLKSEIVGSYLEVATAVCENDASLCETAKAEFGKLKNTFGLSWALIKDIASDGLFKLKNWYEIWSGK